MTSSDRLLCSSFLEEGAFLALSLETLECGNCLVTLATHWTKKIRIDGTNPANIVELFDVWLLRQMVYVSKHTSLMSVHIASVSWTCAAHKLRSP